MKSMSKKGFLVKVELDIQKITCPGVWLCSNGKVSLQIHMLDSSVQTKSHKPVFPILCQERFVLSKIFENDHQLSDLQRSLKNEWFYSELVQWKTCAEGCVLATFQATLEELLYPSSHKVSLSGMDIDLLMQPTKMFPGTIAPKLEVSTKTTIEEIICDFNSESASAILVNPKSLSSTYPCRRNRPRKVCHTTAFSRAQKQIPDQSPKTRPIFKYRRPSDDLILRNNPNVVLKDDLICKRRHCKPVNPSCYCRSARIMDFCQNQILSKYSLGDNQNNSPDLVCGKELHKDKCSVCSTYEGYFSSRNSKTRTADTNGLVHQKLCSFCKNHSTKYHLRSRDDSPCPSEVTEGSRHRICFCLPDEKPSSLARQLHEKLSRTLDTNSKFFQKCIDCKDII